MAKPIGNGVESSGRLPDQRPRGRLFDGAKLFVDRWDHRWETWRTLFLNESRLAVLCGAEDVGKTVLLKMLAAIDSARREA